MAGVITPAQYISGGGGGGAVSSVFGRTGGVVAATGDYTYAQVGADQAGAAAAVLATVVAGYAPLASPALTGTPTAPTAAPGDTSTQLATNAFVAAAVTAAVQGLAVKPSVQEATTTALPANTYSNGASGVGATLTAVLPGVLTVDGVAVTLGSRVLVQDEAAAANNGIYVMTTLGTVSVAYVLTRATDMNQAAEVPGAFVFVEAGTVNAGAGFTVAGAGPYTIGTTAINWTQFSGAGEITAGTGLTKTGNVLSLTGPTLALQATTGTAGYALINGTGNIITWTTPNDGALHRVIILGNINVSSAETGGQITATAFDASGAELFLTSDPGGHGTGTKTTFTMLGITVKANTTVSVLQNTALTVGAATLWAEIWGS